MQSRLKLESAVIKQMRDAFGCDIKRIKHALNVLSYAKEILKKEKGDYRVVIPAAVLHDIGIKECERKYKSCNGQLQEKEGPPIAQRLLRDLELDEEIISQVCRIIASHHSPGEVKTMNFKIIWDSDWLVNLKEECDLKDKVKLREMIGKIFLTSSGKAKAKEIYLSDEDK